MYSASPSRFLSAVASHLTCIDAPLAQDVSHEIVARKVLAVCFRKCVPDLLYLPLVEIDELANGLCGQERTSIAASLRPDDRGAASARAPGGSSWSRTWPTSDARTCMRLYAGVCECKHSNMPAYGATPNEARTPSTADHRNPMPYCTRRVCGNAANQPNQNARCAGMRWSTRPSSAVRACSSIVHVMPVLSCTLRSPS